MNYYGLLIAVCIILIALWAVQRAANKSTSAKPETYLAGAADDAMFNRLRGKIIVAIRDNQSRWPHCTLNMDQPWHLDNSCSDKCYKLVRTLRTLDAIEMSVSGTEQTKAIPFDLVLSAHTMNYAMIPTWLYLQQLENWVDGLTAAANCRLPATCLPATVDISTPPAYYQ